MFTMVTMSAQAQKFGFIDSDALLIEMPKVKQARANLEVLQKQLQTKGQNMVNEFQTKYQQLETKKQTILFSCLACTNIVDFILLLCPP